MPSCKACSSTSSTPTVELALQALAKNTCVDYAGPFQGHMFVIVDAHAKWPEVFVMNSTSTDKTIEVLRQVFAAYGLLEQLVSDNSPQFIVEEFTVFLKKKWCQACTDNSIIILLQMA